VRLERVITEQRERDRLHEHGFSPMRKLLLIGPPGTGKTMTAAALAGELGLPLFSIQLDGLITKYLGETASKLRIVFDAIQSPARSGGKARVARSARQDRPRVPRTAGRAARLPPRLDLALGCGWRECSIFY